MKLEFLQQNLTESVVRLTGADESLTTAVPGLSLHRQSRPLGATAVFYEPALILVCQGTKRITVSDEQFTYDRTHFILTSTDMPAVYQCLEGPSVCLLIQFDRLDLLDLVMRLGPVSSVPTRGLGMFPVTEELLDGVLRLVALLDRPQDIPVLAPLLLRELTYRLLVSDCGALLRQLSQEDSSFNRINTAITWLRRNYSEPLRVEQLAEIAHMSCSSLHHQFKAVTGVSPGQYQKQLRLHEARLLMLGGLEDAASAAQRVGYGSPSHFSREYRRLYGAPPLRDIRQIREQFAY
jgi:AraC-like DNA-binding protein